MSEIISPSDKLMSALPFRELFSQKYNDAPDLAEKVLLPLLRNGHEIHVVSAFVPSYMYRLFRLLANLDSERAGKLHLTLYTSFDLSIKNRAVPELAKYLEQFHTDNDHVNEFARDGLELIERDQVSLTFAFSTAKRPIARGCAILALDGSSRRDYVALVDSKGGDWNSPIRPARSWIEAEQLGCELVLERIAEVNQGKHRNLRLILGWPALELFTSAVDSLDAKSRRISDYNGSVTEDNTADELSANYFDEFESELIEFDFDDDGNLGDASSDDIFDADYESFDGIEELLEFSEGLRAAVGHSDLVDGHAAPLPQYLKNYYPILFATCPCGVAFNRADGCPNFREVS